MNNKTFFDFYHEMEKQNMVLALNGTLSQNVLVGFLELLKGKLAHDLEAGKLISRVFSIFVEFTQNIVRYSADTRIIEKDNREVGTGLITLRETGKQYIITSGNLIENSKVKHLKELCDLINRLNPEELKQHYKSKLKSKRTDNQKGANIGLIVIVRKSGHPLKYEIKTLDHNHSFLILSATVDKKNKYADGEPL